MYYLFRNYFITGAIMLSERDKAVVAQMCRTGMALDVLIESFPQFDKINKFK